MTAAGAVLFLAFAGITALAAVYDLLTLTIPNKLSLALVGAFGLGALATGMPVEAVLVHCAVALAVFAVCFGLFAVGALGGGDAKLLPAVALWFGAAGALPFLLATIMAGGALALAVLVFRQVMLPAHALRHGWVSRLHDRSHGIPYGVAIAAGALLSYGATPWAPLSAG